MNKPLPLKIVKPKQASPKPKTTNSVAKAKPKTVTKTVKPQKAVAKAKPKNAPKSLPKPKIATSPLRKNEEKIAQHYWSNYGAACFAMFLVTFLLAAFLFWAVLNRNPTAQFPLFLTGGLSLFFMLELVRVIMDNNQKRKMELVGGFDKSARSADGFLMRTGYLAQKIGKQTVIFPPQIYFALQKGDYVQVSCTPIFKIVVSCEKVSRTR